MQNQNVAVGFLYHVASGKVLLHLWGTDAPPNPGKWAFFGGRGEPEDGDDLLATWCREMREEIGVTVDPARVVSRSGAEPTMTAGGGTISIPSGRRWRILS